MEYSRRNIGIFFIATLVLTIFSYAPSITGEFLNWDDESYVPNNYLLSSFSIVDVFTSYYMGNYHPLTILSYYFE